jgi:hypothetical protein
MKDTTYKHTQEECTGFVDGYKKAMHDFASNSESKWISVEDRLPEMYQFVIVLADSNYRIAQMIEDKKWENEWTDEIIRVTHWMPLPALPNQ